MARRRGQIPLYEAISKAGSKSKKKTILERLRPKETVKMTPEPAKSVEPVIPAEAAKPLQQKQSIKDKRLLWNKPKLFQIIDGRVEISISYLLAIAILLGIILMLLVAFRLGKLHERGNGGATTLTGSVYRNNSSGGGSTGNQNRLSQAAGTTNNQNSSSLNTGDHVIVIASCDRRADLEPVKEHFAEFGIDTQIWMGKNNKYLLTTKNYYENPERQGSSGYIALQDIIEVGAKYKGKAQQGYETFAPHYFSDAYGMKMK